MTLPVALAGHDIIGQAKTGTGKTLGFGVPMLHRVVAPSDDGFATLAVAGKPQALVVVPTRELAVQVAGDLERAGASAASACSPSTAAAPTSRRSRRCSNGVEIVVGTPGRLLDLAKQGHLDLGARRASWCSTRPTRCSTWASCPTSRRCWR